MINNITLEGRLARDPEMFYTNNAKPILKFSLANETGWGDYKKTSFVNCVIFGKRAESLHDLLYKGKYIIVNGKLIQEKWQDSNGDNRYSFSIHIDELSLVPTGNRRNDTKNDYGTNDTDIPTGAGVEDDDIPF